MIAARVITDDDVAALPRAIWSQPVIAQQRVDHLVQVAPAAEGFDIRHRAAKARVLVLTPRSADLHDRLPEKQAADTSPT